MKVEGNAKLCGQTYAERVRKNKKEKKIRKKRKRHRVTHHRYDNGAQVLQMCVYGGGWLGTWMDARTDR